MVPLPYLRRVVLLLPPSTVPFWPPVCRLALLLPSSARPSLLHPPPPNRGGLHPEQVVDLGLRAGGVGHEQAHGDGGKVLLVEGFTGDGAESFDEELSLEVGAPAADDFEGRRRRVPFGLTPQALRMEDGCRRLEWNCIKNMEYIMFLAYDLWLNLRTFSSGLGEQQRLRSST